MSETEDRLVRRIRRLLRVYPAGPRREDMLDTMVELLLARGRQRPGVRQVLNVLVCGMRARLGHPRSHGIVVLATLVALPAGLFGAAAVAPWGWKLAAPLPEGAAAEQLKREVFPGLTVWGGGNAARWVPTGDGEGEQYGYADYWVWHTAQTRDVDAYTTMVRDRLVARGWALEREVESSRSDADDVTGWRSASFAASRDGLYLRFDDRLVDKQAAWSTEGTAGFTLTRTAPAALWLLEIAGALVAALAAWLATGWVARQVEGRRFEHAVTVLAVAGLMVLVPVVSVVMLFAAGFSDDDPAEQGWFVAQRYLLDDAGRPALLFLGAMIAPAALLRREPWPRPRRALALGAAALALIAGGFGGRLLDVAHRLDPQAPATAMTCVPAVPTATDSARLSYRSGVFIRPETPAEQRNFIEAAIARIPGTRGFAFNYDPTSQAYRDAYCRGAELPPGSGAALPYFWDIDLSSPGVHSGLAAEVGSMPGVVAVRPM